MSNQSTEIKQGDTIRAHSGKHKGKTGKAMTIVRYPSGVKTVLVSFTDGTADYCAMMDLETVTSDKQHTER